MYGISDAKAMIWLGLKISVAVAAGTIYLI